MTAFVNVAAIITAISTQSSISSPRGNEPNTEGVCNVRRFHECFTVYLRMFGKPRMRGVEGTNQHRYQNGFFAGDHPGSSVGAGRAARPGFPVLPPFLIRAAIAGAAMGEDVPELLSIPVGGLQNPPLLVYLTEKPTPKQEEGVRIKRSNYRTDQLKFHASSYLAHNLVYEHFSVALYNQCSSKQQPQFDRYRGPYFTNIGSIDYHAQLAF